MGKEIPINKVFEREIVSLYDGYAQAIFNSAPPNDPNTRIASFGSPLVEEVHIEFVGEHDTFADVSSDLIPDEFPRPFVIVEPKMYDDIYMMTSPWGVIPSKVIAPDGKQYYVSAQYILSMKGKACKVEFTFGDAEPDEGVDYQIPVVPTDNDNRLVTLQPGDIEYLGGLLKQIEEGKLKPWKSDSDLAKALLKRFFTS